MHTDPSGHAILTAILIGLVIGAAVGGTAGGVIAYNAAEDAGLEGDELFWATAKGVGVGAAVGGAAGGLVGLTGGAIATYGLGSAAATTTISGTGTILARAAEVGSLQYKKSYNDGKGGWQIAGDMIQSTFNNAGRILSPTGMKAVTTTNGYIGYYKRSHGAFEQYASTSCSKALSYGFLVYNSYQAYKSATANDPVIRAYKRGYSLI